MRFFLKKSTFFNVLLAQSEPLLQKIYDHPFNQALFQGDLPEVSFRDYLLNDIYYLGVFQWTVSAMVDQYRGTSVAVVFKTLSDMIGTEDAMHQGYSQYISSHENFIPDPCIKRYGNFILSLEHSPLLVQLSGLAPCLWTYRCLPVRYSLCCLDDTHRYYDWIKTYRAQSFVGITSALVTHINAQAIGAPVAIRQAAKVAFERGARHELKFYEKMYCEQQDLASLGLSLDV